MMDCHKDWLQILQTLTEIGCWPSVLQDLILSAAATTASGILFQEKVSEKEDISLDICLLYIVISEITFCEFVLPL